MKIELIRLFTFTSYNLITFQSVHLRAYLNFPTKKYYQVIFGLSSGLFPRFLSSDTRYQIDETGHIKKIKEIKYQPQDYMILDFTENRNIWDGKEQPLVP